METLSREEIDDRISVLARAKFNLLVEIDIIDREMKQVLTHKLSGEKHRGLMRRICKTLWKLNPWRATRLP